MLTNDLWITLRQLGDHRLELTNVLGHLGQRLAELTRDHRRNAKEQNQQHRHECAEHRHHGDHSRYADALQTTDQPFQQISHDNAGKHRCQHLPEGHHQHQPGNQQQCEDHYLRVGKITVIPVLELGKHGHARAWAPIAKQAESVLPMASNHPFRSVAKNND